MAKYYLLAIEIPDEVSTTVLTDGIRESIKAQGAKVLNGFRLPANHTSDVDSIAKQIIAKVREEATTDGN